MDETIVGVIAQILIACGELALLLTAYQITTRQNVSRVIAAYRLQSFILAGTALLIATVDPAKGLRSWGELLSSRIVFAIVLIALLPLALGLLIRWILGRATAYNPDQPFSSRPLPLPQQRLAQAIWLTQRHTLSGRVGFDFLVLILIAFAIVFLGIDIELGEKLGISVSLALHLVGLYNTFARRDILTQVIGLLTMDHGLYLAIVKIVNIPVPATLFVIALYFYTIITIVILFLVLPQLRQAMGTISLDEIAARSELEG